MEWPTLWGEAVDQVPINNLIPTLNEQLFLCQPLAPVVAASGAQAGYSILLFDDTQVTPAEASKGHWGSLWAAVLPLACTREFEAHGWQPYTDRRVEWTDDHSSIFGVMKWKKLLGIDLLALGRARP